MSLAIKPSIFKEEVRFLLKQRKESSLLRTLTIQSSLVDLASNDYLGLASSSSFKEAMLKGASCYLKQDTPIGSTGSRLLTGHHELFEQIEEELASFHGYESALVFSSGYAANLGLLSSLAQIPRCAIIYDIHIHASMHDGITLSKLPSYPFRHQDLDHLESRLKRLRDKYSYIVVCIESLYSMQGTLSSLEDILTLCEHYNAYLIVDEAHTTGVFGLEGQGLCHQYQLQSKVLAQVTTFGKALGCHGAVVLGSLELKKLLINFARSFIYSTAPCLLSLITIQTSYKLMKKMYKERASLLKLSSFFYKECCRQAIQTHSYISPIHPIKVHSKENAVKLSRILNNEGFDVRAILPPTVKKQDSCLRFCLHSFNKEEELRGALSILRKHL